MYKELSKSIYQNARSKKYYNIIEVLSEIQIQLSLLEISIFREAKNDFSRIITVIQSLASLINLRSPGLYDYFMDDSTTIWIINAILSIYLILPLFIFLSFIKTKYIIAPKIGYSWISYFAYIHLYIISFIIHGWLVYQTKKSISYNTIHSALLGFSLTFIIINIVISIFIFKTCLSQVYLPGFIGHKSRYNKLMNLGFKLAFPFFRVFELFSVKNNILLAFLMIWSIIRQLSLILANPFYDYNTFKIMSGMQGITFGMMISNSIAILIITRFDLDIECANKIYGLLLFFISSLSTKFVITISTKKVQKLFSKTKNLSDIDYASQYFLIEEYTSNCHKKELKKQNIKEDDIISNGLLTYHQWKCTECNGEESLQFIRNHLLETKISEGLKMHKDSFILHFIALNFFLQEKHNPYRSYFLLEKMKKLVLSIENKLILKACEVKIEEILLYIERNDNNLDYGKFAACENFSESFLCSTKNTTENYLKFWSEINSPMPNLQNIIKLALKIQEYHKEFKKNFSIYEKKFMDDFAKPLLLAGLYYDILKNNQDKSFFMLQKYRKQMFYNTNLNNVDQMTKDTFYSRDTISIKISGEDDSLGNIISCNGNISEITNENAGKLIGKNIEQILPDCFGAYHDDFIRNFKNTGISNVINHTVQKFCKHESGYFIPIKMNVSVYPDLDRGLMFLGIMKIIKGSSEYIVINQEGKIEGMTLGISKDLNFKASDKINFCSLLHLNGDNHSKEINIEPNSPVIPNLQSLATTQIEYSSSSRLFDRKIANITGRKNGSQLFSRIPHQSAFLFQNFINDYLGNYSLDEKKLILKKIPDKSAQKGGDDNINCEYFEYITSLEKNSYKFGLQLYKLKLTKSKTLDNKFNLKSLNSKIRIRTINYEDNISIEEYRVEPNTLLVNQPFTNKPEFIRELFNDSNQKMLFSNKIKDLIQFEDKNKASSVLSDIIMPKKNNLSNLNENFRGENMIRKESIISHDEFYIEKNMDKSHSIKSIYFIKNAKIRPQTPKKEKKVENVSGQLFKFRSIFLEMNTYLMILLFLLSISGIFVNYYINKTNISQINRGLMISYNCNQRLTSLIETSRRLRYVWLVKANFMSDQRHIARNITSYTATSISRAYDVSQFLINNNSLIAKEIQYLDIISQNDFYSQLIKLYNIDQYGQRLPNYTEINSFSVGYQIYEVITKINKLTASQITINNTDLLFILRNSLNDLYIEYKRSANILINEISSLISNIKQISFIVLLLILSISIISMLLLYPGLCALFYKKKSLLMQIVNINIQYCQAYVYKLNQFFKGLDENYSDHDFLKIYHDNRYYLNEVDLCKAEDQNNKKPNINHKRMVNTFGIKLDLAKSFVILFAISISYILVFSINMGVVQTNLQNINTAIQRILFSSRMLVQQSFAMTIIYEFIGENGTTIVKNRPIEETINETMPIIGDLEGFLTNFRDQNGDLDPNLEFIMVGNACKIVPPDYANECVRVGGGSAQNGISSMNSFIYQALNTAMTVFITSNRTIQDAVNVFSLWYLMDLESMFYRVTMSVYSFLYVQLLEEFDNELSHHTIFGLAWTLISFFCLLIIKMLFWFPTNRKLTNEIISMRRIMKIIPKSIIEKIKLYKNR